MRKTVLAALVCLGSVVGVAQAQEGNRNEFGVSALGIFQQNSTGNSIKQSAEGTPGVLFSYRYFFNAHSGLELNYGYSRFDQQFTSLGASAPFQGSVAVPANTHEATASYIYRFSPRHRFTPFVSAGTGALVFAGTSLAGNNIQGTSTLATGDFVYSAGADLAVNRRLNLRLGYRGHVFQAPDFGLATLYTGSWAHMAEPFGGLSFRF